MEEINILIENIEYIVGVAFAALTYIAFKYKEFRSRTNVKKEIKQTLSTSQGELEAISKELSNIRQDQKFIKASQKILEKNIEYLKKSEKEKIGILLLKDEIYAAYSSCSQLYHNGAKPLESFFEILVFKIFKFGKAFIQEEISVNILKRLENNIDDIKCLVISRNILQIQNPKKYIENLHNAKSVTVLTNTLASKLDRILHKNYRAEDFVKLLVDYATSLFNILSVHYIDIKKQELKTKRGII